MDIRNRYPLCISITVCSTLPPSNIRARAGGQADHAGGDRRELVGPVRRQVTRRGEQETVGGTATTWAMPATLSAKLLSSQAMSCMVGALFIGSPCSGGGLVELGTGRAAALHAAVVGGQQATDLFRRTLDVFPRAGLDAAGHQLRLRHPLRAARTGWCRRWSASRPGWRGPNPSSAAVRQRSSSAGAGGRWSAGGRPPPVPLGCGGMHGRSRAAARRGRRRPVAGRGWAAVPRGDTWVSLGRLAGSAWRCGRVTGTRRLPSPGRSAFRWSPPGWARRAVRPRRPRRAERAARARSVGVERAVRPPAVPRSRGRRQVPRWSERPAPARSWPDRRCRTRADVEAARPTGPVRPGVGQCRRRRAVGPRAAAGHVAVARGQPADLRRRRHPLARQQGGRAARVLCGTTTISAGRVTSATVPCVEGAAQLDLDPVAGRQAGRRPRGPSAGTPRRRPVTVPAAAG